MKKIILTTILMVTLCASGLKPYMLPINLLINIDNGQAILDVSMYASLTPCYSGKKDKITNDVIDEIVKLIEKKSIEDVRTSSGKKELKKELKDIVSRKLSCSKVEQIYFTKFVIQALNIPDKKEPKSNKKSMKKDVYPKFVNELYDNSLRYYKGWIKSRKPELWHKALFCVDSAITIEPNRADLWFLKGVILSEAKTELQLEFALTSFIQAMIIEPKNYSYELMVAQTLFGLGQYEEAIIRYKHIFKTYKKKAMDYKILYPFAISHIALKKETGLLKYINDVLKKYDEHNTDIWIIWAVIHKNMGNKKDAIEILDWLISMNKDSKKMDYLKFLVQKYRGER